MKKIKFSLNQKEEVIMNLIKETDKKILAIWAIDCAERVMPFFEEEFPQDKRPRKALETLQEWINTGNFKMAVIRKASLDSHAAARSIEGDNSAKSAARAAGQAVATAHVKTHSLGPANYALQALYRDALNKEKVQEVLAKERKWQIQHLIDLKNKLENK